MINHAQHKNNTGKKRGVRVNRRFKVEAYLRTREEVTLLDKAAVIRGQSRSMFLGLAGVAEAEKVIKGAE